MQYQNADSGTTRGALKSNGIAGGCRAAAHPLDVWVYPNTCIMAEDALCFGLIRRCEACACARAPGREGLGGGGHCGRDGACAPRGDAAWTAAKMAGC
eukprot:3031378-Pleurochrysis_carterae.AAC.2